MPISLSTYRSTLLARFQHIDPTRHYYRVALTVSAASGEVEWYVQSEWAGWADVARKIERRCAQLVDPHWIIGTWSQSEVPYIVANEEGGLALLFAWGGHALVTTPIAAAHLPDLVERTTAGASGDAAMPSGPVPSAPDRWWEQFEQDVHTRDKRVCRLCDTRIRRVTEFRVHIIRPIAANGPPSASNLLTTCRRCATALQPDHLEVRLRPGMPRVEPTFEDMSAYQAWLAAHAPASPTNVSDGNRSRPTAHLKRPHV